MSTAKDTSSTHRVGLTENEILELIEELTDMKNSGGLSMVLRSAYVKLMDKYNKIDNGTVRADYVPNGRKRESKINMDALGVPAEEQKRYNNPAELSEDASVDAAKYELQLKLKDFEEGTSNVNALSFSAAEIVALKDAGKLPASLNVEAIRAALAATIVGLPASLAAILTESAEKTITAFAVGDTGNNTGIIVERREESRTYQEDSHPTDNDNVHKLFMALKTSDL